MSSEAPDVKTRRNKLRLSQEALAQRAGVNRGTVSSMERGKRIPHPASVEAVLEVLSAEEALQGVTRPTQADPVRSRPYTVGIRLQGDIEILGHADTESEGADLAELMFVALGRSLGRDAVTRLQRRFDDEAAG